jgi:1-acyl-sn-glycerol-3-phosphate acyltransferase
MTIYNSAGVFEDHFPKIKKTTVVVVFDKPVYIDKLDKEKRKSLSTYVGGIISERYFALKKEFSL